MQHTAQLIQAVLSFTLTTFIGVQTALAQTAVQVTPPNLSGSVAGTLSGTSSVDPSGASAYAITLAIPPGTAGVVPNVSLEYSSQAPMGLLGHGWRISILSTISRCGKTLAQDGVTTAVALNSEDQFCLDGQRLLFVAGSGTHGTNGEYRTQLDKQSRVRAFGSSAASGVDRFQVEAKDGLIYTYGETADASIEAVGKPARHTWALSRVEDRRGNYYTLHYIENATTGEYYPTRIRYTGNRVSGLVQYNAINFIYENRPDRWRDYILGSPFEHSVRLTAIRTHINTAADGSGGSLARDYRVSYVTSPSSDRSLVSEFRDCDRNGNCLPATRFTWTNRTAAHNNFSAPGSGVWGGPVAVYENTIHKYLWNSIAIAELNGDGKTDLLKSMDNGTWQACLSTGSSFNCQNWSGPNRKMKDVVIGDFDGNGKADLTYAEYSNGIYNNFICFNTGSSFNCRPSQRATNSPDAVADTDIDGRSDIGFCYSLGDGTFTCDALNTGQFGPVLEERAICPEEQAERKTIVGDFTGDRRNDYLVINTWSPICPPPGTVHAYGYSMYRTVQGGSQVGLIPVDTPLGLPGVNWSGGRADAPGSSVGNFNSDGYSDLVLRGISPAGLSVCYGTGVGFSCTQPAVDTSQYDDSVRHVGDFDGDGRDDTLHFNPSNQARVCQVGGLGSYTCTTWAGAAGPAQVYGDFNGDGKTDIAYYNDGTRQWSVGLADGPTPDLLKTVTNGLGHAREFVYSGLQATAVYTPGSGAAYPKKDVSNGSTVVSEMKVSNGLGGWLTTTYRYGDQRSDQRGRGNLGFGKTWSVDQVSGVTTAMVYSQDFPYTGMALGSTSTSRGGVVLSSTLNTLSSLPTTAGAVCPYVQSTSTTTRDLNNAPMLSTTEQVNAGGIDAYCNITSSTKTVSGGGDSFSTQSVKAYDNLTSSWLIGLIRSSTETRSATQVNAVTTPPSLAFGNCTTNSRTITPTAATSRCTLSNNGQTVVSGISYAAPAGMTASGPATCSANAVCGTVTITSGTAAGSYSGTVTTTPSPTGTAASSNVSLVVLTPPNLSFSSCTSNSPTVNPTAATKQCMLSNNGQTAVTGISYAAPAGVTATGPSTCAANAACGTVTITSGTTAGTYAGAVSATPSPAGTAANDSVNLVVSLTPPSLSFGSCASNSPTITPTAATSQCTLSNSGQTAVTGISYAAPAGFTATGPSTCAGNATCGTVTITSGTAAGTYAGTISAVPTPVGTTASTGVNLVVNVTPPSLSLASCTWTTPTLAPTPATGQCTLSNSGQTAATSIGYMSPSGMNASGPTTCAANAACGTVFISTNGVAGTYTGTVSVTPNPAGTAASTSVNLVVNAPTSETSLAASPTNLAFGVVAKSASKQLSLTLTNTGGASATGMVTRTIAHTTGSFDQGQYVNAGTSCGTTLAAGASCTVSVQYDALCTGGARNGTVTLSGSNFPAVVVNLTASTSSSGFCN
jgi:hypothetical protein